MALVPVLLALAAAILAWMGAGSPGDPRWASALLPGALWWLAAAYPNPVWPKLGLVGLVALAVTVTLKGRIECGLLVVGLALLAWDSADILRWRGEERQIGHVFGRGLLRSGLVVGLGVALGLFSSRARLAFPFWGLIGLLNAMWLALWAWNRSVQGRGGEANGKRSGSPLTK